MLKRMLVGAALAAAVVVGGTPKADAGVDFSFGIGWRYERARRHGRDCDRD